MCTLTIAWRAFPEASVVVAANRDEVLDRPSSPPRALDGEPAILAPRDDEAGGTWIGYNEHGVFAGITNRWTDGDLAGERSRGLLVREALAHADAAAAARAVEWALEANAHDGFNLVIADAHAAILFEWDGRLRVTDLEPGVHVVLNAGYDDRFAVPDSWADEGERQAESARLVMTALRPEDGESPEAWLSRAGAVLGDHEFGVCVHAEGFGTRSSSLIALHDDGAATYRFADGPPCRTGYERVDEQV